MSKKLTLITLGALLALSTASANLAADNLLAAEPAAEFVSVSEHYCAAKERGADIMCAAVVKPVCGSDDKPYNNGCEACKLETVKFHYPGTCQHAGPPDANILPPTPPPAEVLAKLADSFLAAEPAPATEEAAGESQSEHYCLANERGADLMCAAVIKPVCGSDDKPYNNGCEACKVGTVKFHYPGACQHAGEPAETSAAPIETPTEVVAKVADSFLVATPVVNATANATATVNATEVAQPIASEVSEHYCKPEERGATIMCASVMQEVCGSDDKQYNNGCEACKNDKIKYHYAGKCQHVGEPITYPEPKFLSM